MIFQKKLQKKYILLFKIIIQLWLTIQILLYPILFFD